MTVATLAGLVVVALVAKSAVHLVAASHHRQASRTLIRVAARRLPQPYRERYEEEWLADLHVLDERPVAQVMWAVGVVWYSPAMGAELRTWERKQRAREDVSSSRIGDRASDDPSARRFLIRQRLGRLLALSPIAMVAAFVGGFLLRAIGAAEVWFYVFAIALGVGTAMQILARGAGIPRPGRLRGLDLRFEVGGQAAAASESQRFVHS